MRPGVWYAQRTRPVAESTANTRPSCEPKYAVPSTTTGDDSTLPAVRTCQSCLPELLARAVTVPSCEATRIRGPSMAGLEGSFPPTRRVHLTFPVSASNAKVVPGEAVDVELAIAVHGRELDVRAEPMRPVEALRGEPERSVRPGERSTRITPERLPAPPVAHRLGLGLGFGRGESWAASP